MSGWDAARAAYFAAKTASDEHNRANYGHIPASLPIGPERSALVDAIPSAVHDEAERLDDLLAPAEDAIMAIPSPDATGFALKFLIAFGGGRDGGWRDVLEAEALRFVTGNTPGSVDVTPYDKWRAALRAWDVARARFDAVLTLQSKVGRGELPAWTEDEVEAVIAKASAADDEALRRLYATPAPDVAAAAHKLDLAMCNGAEGDLTGVIADLRRLAEAEASA